MTGSLHARYRDRLAVLARPPDPPWTRHFARFTPGRSPWATVVDLRPGPEPRLRTVEVYGIGDAPTDAVDGPAGPVRLRLFPDDAGLPALPRVVRSLGAYAVMRYRPGKRCVLRVGAVGERQYAKVLAPGHGESIIHDAHQLWAASQSGVVGFRTARPRLFDAANDTVWHDEVPGDPVEPKLFEPGVADLVHRLGRALGELSAAPLTPATTCGRDDQLARTARAAERAAQAVPDLAGVLRQHVARLAVTAAALPAPRPVPVHGSPHVHQWLLDGDRLGLVDFDRFASGEPELDIATFVVELESERGLAAPLDAIEAAMVAGFEETGPPLDRGVLDWYRQHKRLAKVARTAFALRPDGDERAARRLAALDAGLAAGRGVS